MIAHDSLTMLPSSAREMVDEYASKRDWAQIAKDLKPVYTAASESEALDRFTEFSGKWEKRYPAITRLWENAWA